MFELGLGYHTATEPSDVTGRHVDDVWVGSGREQGFVEAYGAVDVRVERLVDGRVERDRRCRVDDDIKMGGQLGDAGHAAVEHCDPCTDDALGLFGAHSIPPALEHGFAQKLPEPVLPGLTPLPAHEK